MNNIVVRKVKALEDVAKAIAKKHELEPDDLVILTVSLEKIHGDPITYLLAKMSDHENRPA